MMRLHLKGAVEGAAERLGALPGVESVDAEVEEDTKLIIECAQGSDLREVLFRTAVDESWVVLELVQQSATLEDVFVRLTTKDEALAVAESETAEVPS